MGFRLAGIAFLVSLTACSSAPETPTDPPTDPVSTGQQPVVGTCTIEMFGQPCALDSPFPDSGGSASECANVCWAMGNGQAACVPLQDVGLTLQDMNGRICGTLAGTSCNTTCLNGACVAIPAKAGAACRPSSTEAGPGTTCDGSCQPAGGGAMTCKPLTGPDAGACSFGTSGCSFHACDMANASVCKTFGVYPSSLCDDGNACTTFDYCSLSGTCTGILKNCNDGNICTNDTCDTTSGACIGVPNTSPCSDGNPCTVGDTCNLALCHPGLVTPGCDAGAGGSGGLDGGFIPDSSFGGFGGFLPDSGFGGFGGFIPDSSFGGFGGFVPDSSFGGFGGFVPDSSFGGTGGVFDSGPGGFGGGTGGFGGSNNHDGGGLGGIGGSNADDGGVDGGCGCTVPSQERSGQVGWLLLVAGAAALARRRR